MITKHEISINYDEVFSRISEIKGSIRSQVNIMNDEYNQVQASLNNLDSASNATLIAAIEKNKRKAAVYAEILEKLLMLIEGSSRQVQFQENKILSRFNQTRMVMK